MERDGLVFTLSAGSHREFVSVGSGTAASNVIVPLDERAKGDETGCAGPGESMCVRKARKMQTVDVVKCEVGQVPPR